MVKPQELTYRCLVYQESDGTFTGVCLDLDIVEEDHQTMEQAILSLHDAVETHLKAAAGLKFPKELMYRPAPKRYWNILRLMTADRPQKQNIPSEFRLFPMAPPVFFHIQFMPKNPPLSYRGVLRILKNLDFTPSPPPEALLTRLGSALPRVNIVPSLWPFTASQPNSKETPYPQSSVNPV